MATVNTSSLTSLNFAYSVFVPPNHHFTPHTHAYHELVLAQRGQMRSVTVDKEYTVRLGDVIIYPAGTVHEEWIENNKPMLTWTCAFSWNGLQQDHVVYCRDSRGRIQELIAWLAWEYHEHGPATEDGCAILRTILAEIKRLAAPSSESLVDQVRDFIQKNLANPFTLEDLASIVGMSKSHLAHQYRDLVGRAPMEDVRRFRLEEAKRLISTTSMPLREIAPMVGFRNEFHLSRLLKAEFGVGVRDLRPQDR